MTERKPGRPTKYTPELAADICATIQDGNTFRVAALLNGIHIDTFNEWRNRFPEFSAAVTRAEAQAEKEHVANLRLASRGGDWQASKFWLQSRSRDDWKPPAETHRHGGDPDNPTPLVVERVVFGKE